MGSKSTTCYDVVRRGIFPISVPNEITMLELKNMMKMMLQDYGCVGM